MALPAAGLDALWPQEGAAESPGRTGSAGRGVDVEENHIFFFVCVFLWFHWYLRMINFFLADSGDGSFPLTKNNSRCPLPSAQHRVWSPSGSSRSWRRNWPRPNSPQPQLPQQPPRRLRCPRWHQHSPRDTPWHRRRPRCRRQCHQFYQCHPSRDPKGWDCHMRNAP